MNITEAVDRACDESANVLDALVFMAVWECDRAVDQALKPGGEYETCFKTAFEAVVKEWQRRKAINAVTQTIER